MKVLEKNKHKIIKLYKSGISAAKLARQYKVNHWSITHLLDKNKIKRRTNADSRILYNEKFFTENSDNLYYFWGFMLGDGSLADYKNGRYLTISLHKKDISILEQFCEWLNINKKDNIFYYHDNSCRLNIYSDYIKNNLSKFGIVKRKTYNPVIPKIPKKYIKAFLIGLIDADGSIEFTPNKHYSLHIVGHKLIMNWVIKQLRILGFNGNINSQIDRGWKRIRIQRNEDIIEIAKILNIKKYFKISLKRKWVNLYKFLSNKLKIKFNLKEKQVIKIKKLLKNNNLTKKEIAIKFDIKTSVIYTISSGQNWKHVKI